MAHDASDDPVVDQVDRILDELLAELARHTHDNEVSDVVRNWWRSHYRAKFYFALQVKGRTYAEDRDQLMKKAKELGEVVAEQANGETITTLHAVLASFKVDCRGARLLENWCN